MEVIKVLIFLVAVSIVYTVAHSLMVCFGEIAAIVVTLGIAHFIIKKMGIA